jgi:hypothetical protein
VIHSFNLYNILFSNSKKAIITTLPYFAQKSTRENPYQTHLKVYLHETSLWSRTTPTY